MEALTLTLMGDGASDRALVRHLEWLLADRAPSNFLVGVHWAEIRMTANKPRGLVDRIKFAIEMYPCDLLVIHRDAERQPSSDRVAEIEEAIRDSGTTQKHIPVVPIRMMEAWLLFDEGAIRSAAGNPNGRQCLTLPRVNAVESLPNPKQVLNDLLKSASGLSGRRLRRFRGQQAASRVADYIQDFSPLRQLNAFHDLESSLRDALGEIAKNARK